MLDILKIEEVMYGGLEALGVKIYPERPEATEVRQDVFVVAELPVGFRSREIGGQEGSYDANVSTARIEVFVRDRMKASAPNDPDLPTLGLYLRQLLSLFPIISRSDGIGLVNPRVLSSGSSDGNGFHYCIVQATVSTMV